MGYKLENVVEQERDAALGNGGESFYCLFD